MTMHANERRFLVARAQRRTHQGGAAMVEYSLILFAVLICGAAATKRIGPAVACAGANATDSLAGGIGGGACEGVTASASGSGSASGASGGANAGSVSGASSAAADEAAGGAGSGNSGYVASSTSYDDGAGGFIGGSGSRSGGLGNPNAAEMDPGSAPPSGASSFSGVSASGSATHGSNGNASNGSSASSGAAGSGSSSSSTSGGGGGGGRGSGEINGPEDQYASEGNKFASQVTGTKPQQRDMMFAEVSMNTDGFNGKTPTKGADGFVPASKQQLANAGISQSMLVDNNDGFAAQVFTDNKGDYVVAYRGTQFPSLGQAITDPKSVGGIAADVGQGAGLGLHTRQFAEAVRLAQAAKTAYGNNVVFTGHSLGGALAATSAMATGLPAVTYNSAGVNDKTLQDLGLHPAAARAQAANGQIKNYEVDHEILSGAQNMQGSMLSKALGKTIEIQDPNSKLTASDAKQSNPLNPWPLLNREVALHSDFVSGMKASSVKYRGADGKIDSYSFTDPPHS